VVVYNRSDKLQCDQCRRKQTKLPTTVTENTTITLTDLKVGDYIVAKTKTVMGDRTVLDDVTNIVVQLQTPWNLGEKPLPYAATSSPDR